ncbi:MAG: YcgN family cysteine cluster protein [Porticoccaceae bacterium]
MEPFWEYKALAELDAGEWEALCDGCGRCCLLKLEDADRGAIAYTGIACRLLDIRRCRCRDYDHRQRRVPDCQVLNPVNVPVTDWLPDTCAYRLRAAGKPLPAWHPLISGDPDSVHTAGISVRDRVISEEFVHPDAVADHVVRWVG